MVTITSTQKNSLNRKVWWFRALIAFAALMAFNLFLGSSSRSLLLRSNQQPPTFPLTKHTLRIYKDNELAYMLPPKKTRGLLLFFHGCEHAAEDLFYLPQDRLVAAEALNRGLAVLAITSQDRESGCWSRNEDIEELQKVKVVDQWMKNVVHLDTNLPRIGMGASSGGAMAVMAVKVLNLKAIASYIMAIPYQDEMVPTAYVHMPRDEHTAKQVKLQVAALEKAGVDTLELTLEPHPFTEKVCNQYIPELGNAVCHELIESARQKGLLDSNFMVKQSYKGGAWDVIMEDELHLDAILEEQEFPDTDHFGHSRPRAAVKEEIAVAYGKHEMSAEHANQVLDFLMKHAGII